MKRRERLENKVGRRQEWAAGRTQKAEALIARNEPYRGDYAFNTQPGHIPERARVIRREDKALEHYRQAAHHEERAEGLQRQLDRSIYSDDENAIEALEARIAGREAERDRIKAYNASCRKAAKAGEKLGDLSLLSEEQQADLRSIAAVAAYQLGKGGSFPAYTLSLLGANIKRDRERIEDIRRATGRQAQAEAAPGGVVVERHPAANWAIVRFAEKPERSILDALRAAGYRWGSGQWQGALDSLPAEVAELADAPAEEKVPEADPAVYACPDGASCPDPECQAENARRAALRG